MPRTSSLPVIPTIPSAWKKLSSTAVRERGVDYFLRQKARLHAPAKEGEPLAFVVKGSTPYWVMLQVDAPLASSCTCPHAESVHVCKHMVAALLTWQAMQAPPAASTPRSAPATTARKPAAAKQPEAMQADIAFLQAQPLSALQAWVAEQCDRNPEVATQLRLWRQKSDAATQVFTPAQWRSWLTKAMPQKQHLYGRDLQRWADNALHALQDWEGLLSPQPESLRTACTLALRRLYKLWETADDSDGQLYQLHDWLRDMLQRSVHAAPPPASWLKEWLALLEADLLGNWDEAAFLAQAGSDLQHAYSRHVIAQWEAWSKDHPAQTTPRKKTAHDYAAWEASLQRSKLRKRYLWAMAQSMDHQALLRLMQETAQSESDWLDTYAFCEQHQRHREALAVAQQGVHHYPQDDLLRQALLQCYMRDGWDEEALQLAEQLALAQPHQTDRLEAYVQCAQALGHDRQTAQATLLERLWTTQTFVQPKPQQVRHNITAAVHWLLQDNDVLRALAWCQRPGAYCEHNALRQLAVRLPASHAPHAIQLLHTLLKTEMEQASSPYHHALQLVHLILARMPTTHDATLWLKDLRQTYAPKRKFLEGLRALAPTLCADL